MDSHTKFVMSLMHSCNVMDVYLCKSFVVAIYKANMKIDEHIFNYRSSGFFDGLERSGNNNH